MNDTKVQNNNPTSGVIKSMVYSLIKTKKQINPFVFLLYN